MEDKRTALAVLLSVVVVLLYSQMVMAPQHQQPARHAPSQLPSGPGETDATPASYPSAATPSQQLSNSFSVDSVPTTAMIAQGQITTVTTQSATIEISNLGARFRSYRLQDYKRTLRSKELLDLVNVPEGTPLPLGAHLGTISDLHVPYTLLETSPGVRHLGEGRYIVEPTAESATFRFQGELKEGGTVTKTFTFNPRNFLFEVDVEFDVENMTGDVWLEWTEHASLDEIGNRLDPTTVFVLGQDNKLETLPAADIKPGSSKEAAAAWAAVGGKYFVAALIPSAGGMNAWIGRIDRALSIRARGKGAKADFHAYIGAKDKDLLDAAGYQLRRTVDLGVFTVIASPLLSLIRVFYLFLGNYGLAIILLTLVIKLAFLPLTGASMRSMKAMQDLQPEMKALRERISDQQQLSQEIMALYKKHNVNPVGGCFPILIQLPIFLGLYNALLNSIDLRHAGFALWINDLSDQERLNIFGWNIPVMIILMGLAMFYQQYTAPATGDATQRKVMLLMPVIFTVMFIIFPFPSGLVLYWLVNNIISIVQQISLRAEYGLSPLKATLAASVGIFVFGYLLTLV